MVTAAAAAAEAVMTSLDHSSSFPVDERSTTTTAQRDVASAVLGIIGLIVIGLVIIVSVVRISTHLTLMRPAICDHVVNLFY